MDNEANRLPFGLPPKVRSTVGRDVQWEQINGIDYELIGYFLSCHLVIEHYMDELLKQLYPALDWDAAKPTFGQRVALLSNLGLPERYDCVPAIKHMNTIRNKLSHRLQFQVDDEALLPMRHYLQKAVDTHVPAEPKELLNLFVTMACSTLAGTISRLVRGVA